MPAWAETTPIQSATQSAAGSSSRTIVVMGDSISAGYGIQREQGWVHLLQQNLEQGEYAWHAVNASISGETSGGGVARLQAVMDSHQPGIVILELGGNDGLRGYPITNLRKNLTRMVHMVQAQGATPLLVAMRIPPNYGQRYSRAFDGVFAEVATTTGASLVPFFLEEVALDQQLMQSDGIHPTAAAQPALLDAIWPHLVPHL